MGSYVNKDQIANYIKVPLFFYFKSKIIDKKASSQISLTFGIDTRGPPPGAYLETLVFVLLHGGDTLVLRVDGLGAAILHNRVLATRRVELDRRAILRLLLLAKRCQWEGFTIQTILTKKGFNVGKFLPYFVTINIHFNGA